MNAHETLRTARVEIEAREQALAEEDEALAQAATVLDPVKELFRANLNGNYGWFNRPSEYDMRIVMDRGEVAGGTGETVAKVRTFANSGFIEYGDALRGDGWHTADYKRAGGFTIWYDFFSPQTQTNLDFQILHLGTKDIAEKKGRGHPKSGFFLWESSRYQRPSGLALPPDSTQIREGVVEIDAQTQTMRALVDTTAEALKLAMLDPNLNPEMAERASLYFAAKAEDTN